MRVGQHGRWATFGAIAVLVALALANAQAVAADSCAKLIAPALRTLAEATYPEFRIPREADNTAEDISYNREHGGTGCLGYASADFNGDGKPDAVIDLSALNGDGAAIVVALANGSTWTLWKLDRLKDGGGSLHVATGAPGRYDRVMSRDGPLEKGEVESFTCAPLARYANMRSRRAAALVARPLNAGVRQQLLRVAQRGILHA